MKKYDTTFRHQLQNTSCITVPLHDYDQVSHELAPFVKRRAPALGDPATSAGLHKGTLARTMRLVENTFSFTKGQDAETASQPRIEPNQAKPTQPKA